MVASGAERVSRRRIQSIVDAALDQPAADLAAPLIEAASTPGAPGRSMPNDVELAALGSALGDRYRIDREIGRGGMAVVYLAHDVKHRRDVAIKVLRSEVAHAVGTERFLSEIETVAGLSHPHILPLHDSGAAGGFLYYTMPFVEGESLRDALARDRQLPVPLALRFARECADALAYAHRRGIVHRDIKPANILLAGNASPSAGPSTEGSAVHALVADFGIARAVDRAGRDDLTVTGLLVGTPAYMSPEQASGERNIDGRSDIYSLGCSLFEMLAGEPPFAGPSAQAVIARRMTGPVPRVSTTRPIPAEVDDLVARTMAPLAADRPQTAEELAEALARVEARLMTGARVGDSPAAETGDRRSRPIVSARAAWLVGGAIVLVAAIALGATAWRRRSPIVPGASTIAVVPFMPAGADTSLRRLGRELTITLGRSLDGVGGIRTVDPLMVLAQIPESSDRPSLASTLALGRRLGASSVVYGTLVRAGDRVRLDATLYATADSGHPGRVLASATVTTPASDITTLTDSTTWGLLDGIWRTTNPPTPSLAALTTHSVPALKSFLEGERLIADGQWRRASDVFEQAFAADSTFWMAYWRYAFVRNYYGLSVDSTIVAKIRDHRRQLPERDRLMVEATMTDSLSVGYQRAKAVAAQFPDYWPAWWTLSEHLTHSSPLIGTNGEDMRSALEKTLALNPRMVPAWQHLFWAALWQRDTILSGRIVRELTALRYDSLSRVEQGFDDLAYLRYLDALARGGGLTRDSSLSAPGVRQFASMTGPVEPHQFSFLSAQYGFPAAQQLLSRSVLARKPSPAVVAAQHLSVAVAHAARGTWDSALVSLDSFAARSTDPTVSLYRYRVAVVGTWLGAIEGRVADRYRDAAARETATSAPEIQAELAWVDGLLAAARQDRAGIAVARRAIRATGSPQSAHLDRSLAALELSLAGERGRAGDSLVALERERAERGWSRYRSDVHPFLTAIDRLAAARWLLQRGDAAAAAPLLTWHEAFPYPLRITRAANAMVAGLAYLEQARVAAAMGREDLARDYYQRFLWIYDAPTPAHQHLVDEAVSALAKMRKGR
jgi:TolB-like protein